ncbi:MAG: 2-phosphosulfolactate phosphatase [Bacteroidales bacterium]
MKTKPIPLTVEVCFCPLLFPHILTKENYIVVVVDIWRATTSICTAFAHQVKEIIPVAGSNLAKEYKQKGYLVASECNGKREDFADFGNSAFNFMKAELKGKTIVYNTTNGTQAIILASKNSSAVVIGAFSNLHALGEYLLKQNKNVVILCSGWKNKFCLEDSLFAGALSEYLLGSALFKSECDSAKASLLLYQSAKNDLLGFSPHAVHFHRLHERGLEEIIPYSLLLDSCPVVPIMKENKLILESALLEI